VARASKVVRRNMRDRWAAVLTLAGAVTWSSCAGGPDVPAPPDRVMTGDSAGIAIVTSVAPRLSEGAWPTVSDTPSFVLGAGEDETEPALLWSRVDRVLWDPDGNFVVLDRGTLEFRSFDSSGSRRTVFGGRGEGPAEFRGVPEVALGSDGEILAWDRNSRRLTRFAETGELLQTLAVPGDLGSVGGGMRTLPMWTPAPSGLLVRKDLVYLSDGVPIAATQTTLPERSEIAVRISVVDPESEQVTQLPGLHGRLRQLGNLNVPFDPRTDLWVGGSPLRILVSGASHWELREHSMAGELIRILRADIPRIDAAELPQFEGLASAQRIFEAYGRPDSLPAIAGDHLPGAFSTVFWDHEGGLWVRRNSGQIGFPNPARGMWVTTRDESDPVFDVFGQDGEWRFTITVPRAHGEVAAVSPRSILTVWRDPLGVEFLHVYPLRWPDGVR
jgi:hypothetical protein